MRTGNPTSKKKLDYVALSNNGRGATLKGFQGFQPHSGVGSDPNSQFTVRLRPDDVPIIKGIAQKEGKFIAQLLREIIAEFVDRYALDMESDTSNA